MLPVQELYLDAAALPDLRSFISGLLDSPGVRPGSGPGACTGLYLVDQMLPGPPHMEALGQLKELKVEGGEWKEGHREINRNGAGMEIEQGGEGSAARLRVRQVESEGFKEQGSRWAAAVMCMGVRNHQVFSSM